MAFIPFLMLHHFSRIIYLILYALHPLTCHLEEISKLIYSTKPFLLRLPSLSYILSGFRLLCTQAILSRQVGFEPQFTREVRNLLIKKFLLLLLYYFKGNWLLGDDQYHLPTSINFSCNSHLWKKFKLPRIFK